MPDPAHSSPAYGRPTPKAASTCSIGRSGRNNGSPAAHLARPNSRLTGHSSSLRLKTSSGPTAKHAPQAQKCAKSSLETEGFLLEMLRRRTPSAPAPIFCFLAHITVFNILLANDPRCPFAELVTR